MRDGAVLANKKRVIQFFFFIFFQFYFYFMFPDCPCFNVLKVIKMLVIVVLLFGISWLPYQVLLMVFSFSWHVAKNYTLYLKKNTSCICRPTSRWLWSCPLSTSLSTSTCSSCFHTGGFTLLSLEKTYLKNSFSGWP